jgi:hypothetical protein
MKKILIGVALVGLMVASSGCLQLAAVVIGAAGTGVAARYKYKGDIKKAQAIKEFRDTVVDELTDISKRLDEEGI